MTNPTIQKAREDSLGLLDAINEHAPFGWLRPAHERYAGVSAALDLAERFQQDNERLRLENERLTFAADPEALTIAHMHGVAAARDDARAEIERLTKERDEAFKEGRRIGRMTRKRLREERDEALERLKALGESE